MEKKQQRLSKQQRHLLLNARDGAFFRKHRRPDDVECYRLLTADMRPVLNTTAIMIKRLQDRGYLQYADGKVQLSDSVFISPAGRIFLRNKEKAIPEPPITAIGLPPGTVVRSLGLHQPFASLMLHGKIETRPRETKVRGWVLIYSTKTECTPDQVLALSGPHIQYAIARKLDKEHTADIRGGALCLAKLVDCRPMTPNDEVPCYVQYHPGKWCWIFDEVIRIKPFPIKGKQGWGILDQETINKIEREL